MALHEDDYDYNDNISRTAQDLSEPLLRSSALAQAGAIIGFFVGLLIGILLAFIAYRSEIRIFWLGALACLPLGLILGGATGGLMNWLRSRRRRKKPKKRKRRSNEVHEDDFGS